MNAHLVVLIVVTCLFAAVWSSDCRHCEAARLAAAESRPVVAQESAMATLTRNHRRELLARQQTEQLKQAELAGSSRSVLR